MTFKESTYYVMKGGKVYRNVTAGLIEEKWTITRKINDDIKIHAEHFDCACPYSNYYVLDFKNQKIYEAKDNQSYLGGKMKELVDGLKANGIGWIKG